MLFDTVNIAEELSRKEDAQALMLEEVNALFNSAASADQQLLERLKHGENHAEAADQFLQQLDQSRLYSQKSIHAICVKYRLRFLDSESFKGEFPYEALMQIKQFEQQHGLKIKRFKVVAPYSMFHLKDANEDPLLFAQLGNNSYYLLHKWGKDLSWHRSILYYPLRSIYTFFNSVIVLAALLAWSIPFEWLQVSRHSEALFRFWLNTHFTIAFFFFLLFIGSLSNAAFSDSSWDSRNYND